LAGGLVGGWRFFRTPSAGIAPSIVVLPFTNLSANPANEYFADGLTDEITGELVRLNSLKVLARTSARAFKGKSADVREVGRQLNVSYVLEGSVERSGDQVRISAHLERASDGSHVWSQTYDRPAKDLLTVQSELAAAIANSLQVNSSRAAASRHVPNEEAHELYMRGSFEIENGTLESIAHGEQDLRRAVQIDPKYAEAWTSLGAAKYNLARASGRNHTPAELTEAKGFYHKALDLDPAESSARANLGIIALTDDWDWKTAERELQLASREGPSAAAEMQYGLLLSFRGRFSEADRRMESARALDPLDSSVSMDIVLVRYWESRFPEAIELSRQMLERFPDLLGPQMMLNLSYIQGGQPEVALANLRPIETRLPPMRLLEAMALGRSGRREQGLSLIHQLETEYEADPQVFRQWFALAWAALGDHAETLKWLERSADLREFQVLNLAVNPAFAEMRNDPGFRALVKRIGL
jgi:TolB-like protein/tetratricopeptide (TPR) repeat protein